MTKIKSAATLLSASATLLLGLAATPAFADPSVIKSVKVPQNLYEIAFDAANDTLYVAVAGPLRPRETSGRAPKLVALDPATLAVKASYELQDPIFGLKLNNVTQTLYATSTVDHALLAIDAKTGKVVATIAGTDKAHLREAVPDEATNRVYVSVPGGGPDKPADEQSAVWIVDGATNKLLQSIPVPVDRLLGLAVDGPGKRLFLTGMVANEVAVFDLASQKIVAHWPTGGNAPINVVYDAQGQRLFVANNKSGDLSVMSAKDGKLLAQVKTGDGALDVAFVAPHNQIYVTNRNAGTVSVLDGTSYKVLGSLKTGTYPQTVVFDSKDDRVFVSNKAKMLPRNAPADAKPIDDPEGDTVTAIKP